MISFGISAAVRIAYHRASILTSQSKETVAQNNYKYSTFNVHPWYVFHWIHTPNIGLRYQFDFLVDVEYVEQIPKPTFYLYEHCRLNTFRFPSIQSPGLSTSAQCSHPTCIQLPNIQRLLYSTPGSSVIIFLERQINYKTRTWMPWWSVRWELEYLYLRVDLFMCLNELKICCRESCKLNLLFRHKNMNARPVSGWWWNKIM